MDEPLVLAPVDFVALTNQTLEFAMPFVVIEGELAEFKVRKNQWVYFKVKDEFATVDCFGTVYMLPGPLDEGMVIRVSGRPRLHERFGFSFSVQSIQPAGEGSIKKAYELLRAKLEQEGLFDESRKRRLPYPPQSVAVVTSAEGAAVGDFKKILSARWPFVDVQVFDVFVQGEKAPESVEQAFKELNTMSQLPDVIVLIRGGGSAEDLAAFNDERVVRAVASSRIPTLVAIGHEQDISLAELAADLRASTPSNAAELLVPDRLFELEQLKIQARRIEKALGMFTQRLSTEIAENTRTLRNGIERIFRDEYAQLEHYSTELRLVSPKHIMERGYVVVRSSEGVMRSSHALKSNQTVELLFHDGSKHATID